MRTAAARRGHRHCTRGALVSRTTSPSTGSTATARRTPGTARRCRRPTSSWTDVRAGTIVVRATLKRTAHHPRTGLYLRQPCMTRPPAGRLLAAAPRPPTEAPSHHDTPPSLTPTMTDNITQSPTTRPSLRACVPTQSVAEDRRSSRPSRALFTCPTARMTASAG